MGLQSGTQPTAEDGAHTTEVLEKLDKTEN